MLLYESRLHLCNVVVPKLVRAPTSPFDKIKLSFEKKGSTTFSQR
jgi:hypothetical protein